MQKLKRPLTNLISARRERKLTQEELANLVNISRVMLSHIERGYAVPSLPVAFRISKALNKTIEFLFGKGINM